MRLALGTAQFGLPYGIANTRGQVPLSEAKSMLSFALEKGINALDTAISYGDSEACLGQLGIKDFNLITKLPALPDGCDINRWVTQQLEGSLSRLDVNKIYGLLLHCPEQLLGVNGLELYQSLNELKEKGLVEKIGISIYSPKELDALMPKFCFDLIQAPFNLIDQRLFDTGWLGRLKDMDVEIHTRSVFLQGLLLIHKSKIPIKFSQWCDLWDNWHHWLAINDIMPLQAALHFPFTFPEIDRVVVGVDNYAQLFEVINTANNTLDISYPKLKCEDDNLINPSNWSKL